MHIEPGVVHGAKMALAYATAEGGLNYTTKLAIDEIKLRGIAPLITRSTLAVLAGAKAGRKFLQNHHITTPRLHAAA